MIGNSLSDLSGTLTNDGTVSVGLNISSITGELINNNDFTITNDIKDSAGDIDNFGTLTITNDLQNYTGTFTNWGVFNVRDMNVPVGGNFINTSLGLVFVNRDILDISGTLTNAFILAVLDDMTVSGTVTNETTASIGVGDNLTIDGSMENQAVADLAVGNLLTVNGMFLNDGATLVTACNLIIVASGGTYTNNGTTGTTDGMTITPTACHNGVICEGTCDGLNSILPVELLYFHAAAKEGGNLLQWATASEENTAEHWIEHSADGRDWTKIGSRPGAGYSQEVNTYEFLDRDPYAHTYYRIRFVDYDGYEELSPILSVVRDREGDRPFVLAPNPFRETVRLEWEATQEGSHLAQVFDLAGRIVLERNMTASPGARVDLLPVDDLPAGTYFLRLYGPNGEDLFTDRLVKVRD